MDGTLVDSSRSILCAANQALVSARLPPMELGALVPLIGVPIREIFRRTADAKEEVLDQLVQAYRAAYPGCQRLTTVHAGMADLLADVTAAGGSNVIVTTKSEGVAAGVLKALGLAHHIGGVIGDDGRRPLKPSPIPILDACRLVGVQSSDAVMVGDTLHDAEAARGAGVHFVGVSWGYGSEALRTAGLPVCSDAGQLAAALRR